MKSKIAVFIAAFMMWCLLGWVPDWQHVVTGVVIAAITAFITGDMFSVHLNVLKYPGKFMWLICYVGVFFWEMVKANIDVALKLASPGLNIKPGIIKISFSLKSETAAALLANSVTLASRTVTVDADIKNGILYVHCMALGAAGESACVEKNVRRFENILKRIFE